MILCLHKANILQGKGKDSTTIDLLGLMKVLLQIFVSSPAYLCPFHWPSSSHSWHRMGLTIAHKIWAVILCEGMHNFFPSFSCYTQRLSSGYLKKNETKDAKCSKKWKVNVSFFELPCLQWMKDFTEFGKVACKHTYKYILMFCDTINTFKKRFVVYFNGGFRLVLCTF